jgi:hypothetical protein
MRRFYILMTAALLLGVAAAAAALASGASDGGSAAAGAPPPPPAYPGGTPAYLEHLKDKHKTPSVTSAQIDVVKELGRAQNGADAVPAKIARTLADGNSDGINAGLARRVTLPGGASAWLAPGSDAICLVTADPSGLDHGFGVDCQPTDVTARGGLSAVWVAGENPDTGAMTVIGVAPNDSGPLYVVDRRDAKRRVRARHNVYIIKGRQLRQIELKGAHGRVRARLGN